MNQHNYESYAINTLRSIGADYQQKYGSMTFAKNGIVMVVDYNECASRCFGSIMTYYAYSQMCETYEKSNSNMTLACFAWSYGWGYDFLRDSNMDAIPAFQYAVSIESAPYLNMNRVGAYYGDVVYVVREQINDLPHGEYGVCDTYCIIGIFSGIDAAFKASAPHGNSKSNVVVIPMLFDTIYVGNDKPCLGRSIYIV